MSDFVLFQKSRGANIFVIPEQDVRVQISLQTAEPRKFISVDDDLFEHIEESGTLRTGLSLTAAIDAAQKLAVFKG